MHSNCEGYDDNVLNISGEGVTSNGCGKMLAKIDSQNEQFFHRIAEFSIEEQTNLYPRTVVILHPGTEVKDDGGFPFRAPNADDAPLSTLQVTELEGVLLSKLGPDASCSLAVYAGYMRGEEFHRLIEPEGTKFIGNLQYILFNGTLAESLFHSIANQWDPFLFLELSFLWARDRSWLITSTPDTAVTIVGCDDLLADALLSAPTLGAFDWPSST